MKKLWKNLLGAAAGAAAVLLGYSIYVFAAYDRLEDRLPLTVENARAAEAETERVYTAVSYNLGFGAYSADYSFFMDGGTESRAYSAEAVRENISGAMDAASKLEPDFLLLQEVDRDATRSYHVDEVSMAAELMPEKTWVYAQNYDSPYLFWPVTEPHGASKSGIVTMSACRVDSALRRSLPVAENVSCILDLDRCYSVSRIPVENGKTLCLYNAHLSAYLSDGQIAMEQLDEYPDIVIGCAGGGSNLGGLIAPFMQDKLTGKADPRIIAVEPASCPSLTRGVYKYDFCDTGKITPMAKMYTLGCTFKPSANHAGGLRYHGMSPILSKLYADKYMEAEAYEQTKVFEAAVQFAKLETILPAPESAHAIRGAIDEALKCKETGEEKTILFGLTGTGYFDMTAYAAYNEGRMNDTIPTDEDLQPSIDALPTIPGIQE